MPAPTPTALPVDETLSYAHRVEGGVHVVVRLPGSALVEGAAEVRFRSDGRGRRAPAKVTADGGGVTVELTEPRRLPRGVWQLAVRQGERWQPLEARVVAGPPPLLVSLVTGPSPRTRMEPPEPVAPRRAVSVDVDLLRANLTSNARTATARARRVAGRVVRAARSRTARLRS
ncbi:hypothetical protein [Nocardioides sp. KR10-350]|uniref:hypothetical protein n=1 Tax=Nocardioides cheoyonin TaxID=3156615 RepID=UPI0032B49AA5